jgi:beta-glucanase (GH16 family)
VLDAGGPWEYHLTFDDEFNDTNDFVSRDGGHVPGARWGTADFNGVRTVPADRQGQYFCDPNTTTQTPYNAFLATNGSLKIAARPTPPNVYSSGMPYVSGQIASAHRFTQRYGYFELRARLPRGMGLWSRYWLLPDDGAWPGQGEYDIFEVLGKRTGIVNQTTHFTDDAGVNQAEGFEYKGIDPVDGAFHTYGLLWLPDRVEWYVDQQKTLTQINRVDIPMYVLIDLAVGGSDPGALWAGNPDSTTPWPSIMEVDSFRIYSNDRGLPSVTPDPGYSPSTLPPGLAVVAGSPHPALPTGWTAGPIGTPDLPGTTTWNPDTGEWMLKGAGYGFQCQFASTSLAADGSVAATVESVTEMAENDDRAGVAMRGSLQEVQPELSLVFMASHPANQPASRRVVLISRGNGATTELASATIPHAPVSLRLVRTGNTFTGSYSTNGGTSWTVVGSTQNSGLTGAVRAGLVVGGNQNSYHRLSRASFSDVSVTP